MYNRYLLSTALGRHRFADGLVDYLITMGVGHIFGMPAESVNSLVDAASRRSEIEVVTTRHESAAALMAVGYAKSSGRLGVCFGTAGPGATNLLAGTYEAFLARVPVLAISGQVPVASIGRGSFQEINSEALFRPCTSSSVQIHAPSQFERFVRSAVTAVHESTACHVAIPGDVLYAPMEPLATAFTFPQVPAAAVAGKEQLSAIADFLDSDDLAIVVSGADGDHADAVAKLSERFGCPLYTLGDQGVIAADNVLIVGRASPLVSHRVRGHAKLLEITDRRCTTRGMPYTAQIVCDIEATLREILDATESDPAGADPDSRCEVYRDLDRPDRFLPPELHSTPATSSLAGIPGAALPLGIGGALAGSTPTVVVTDRRQLGQFAAELSTLVAANADVLVVCAVEDTEIREEITHLGRAMSIRTASAESMEALSRLLRELAEAPGPAIVALRTNAAHDDPANVARHPGEQSLFDCLTANIAAPVQISEFCAHLLPCFDTAQRSANAQGPSMSASALRKAGSSPACTVAATGPALLLQLNGIYDAALDNARILVTTVQRRDWFVDAAGMLDEVTVARYVVDDPATAAATVRQACAAAGAPGAGVVHLHVTPRALDVEWGPIAPIPPAVAAVRPREIHPGTAPDESPVARAAGALRDADRVGIVAGRGAAGCSELLVELSEMLGCTVYLTMGGDSVLNSSISRKHSRIGGSGDLRAWRELARADALFLVGVSNRGSAFDLGTSGRTVAVNVDPLAMLELGERDICVLGDAVAVLEAMVATLRAESGNGGRSAPGARRRRIPAPRMSGLFSRADGRPLRASSLTRAIDAQLRGHPGTSTVCADVGVNTLWVYRYVTSMTRSVWSASFGTMGFAVPAAIALARNATASETVVAIAGDGGTSVTLSQLRSAAGIEVPLVFVVVNNAALAAIKFESEIMGWPDRGSAIPEMDFAHYATSVGVRSRRVGTLRDFRDVFAEAIRTPGPYLIDARCVLNDAPIQAATRNWRQVLGFFTAWSKSERGAADSFREVVRAVVLGKFEERLTRQ